MSGLLVCWPKFLLAWRPKPLPRLSHWLGHAISCLDRGLHSQDLLFFLPASQPAAHGEGGAHKGAPSFPRKRVESRPHHGPEAPGLVVSWSSVCVCDQNPRGSRWVNVTLWLRDCGNSHNDSCATVVCPPPPTVHSARK